jgi:hypothetical protein
MNESLTLAARAAAPPPSGQIDGEQSGCGSAASGDVA